MSPEQATIEQQKNVQGIEESKEIASNVIAQVRALDEGSAAGKYVLLVNLERGWSNLRNLGQLPSNADIPLVTRALAALAEQFPHFTERFQAVRSGTGQ
ncbi:MAG: hypothetical protein HC848_10620 [Limnobacter sp.]|nr:hypothetical protein [Limnobacter sp.]